jgi:hypothetical protein
MRFLSIYTTIERDEPPREPSAEMAKFIEEQTRAGVLLQGEGCLSTAKGARVRRSGEKLTVTDGPFTEAKEVIGGFALLQVRSKEEAIEMAKRFLNVAGDGECELRQVFEPADFA